MAEAIYQRLLEIRHCVIATASKKGEPAVAAMQFAKDGEHIILKTFNDSRKYTHLTANPQVSMMLYDKPDYAQLDGWVLELRGDEAQAAKRKFIEKYGDDAYLNDERMRYLRFTSHFIKVQTRKEYPPEFVVLKDSSQTS